MQQQKEVFVDEALTKFAAYISAETQAHSFAIVPNISNATVLEMEDFELSVEVRK